MAEPRQVVIYSEHAPTVLFEVTEVDFPGADKRFRAYQRADKLWLSVNPNGNMTFTPDFGSYQAFQPATNAALTFADRRAFPGGNIYTLACVAFSGPLGPAA